MNITISSFLFRHSIIKLLSASIILAVTSNAAAEDATEDLTKLSIEDLMNIQVTTAARKQQSLANVAAAAFVVTQDDIRRSGATNIPDILRMVPGVHVAQIDANKWAVSIRGFNGRFANKLLVLKDGRSLYTPLFSGVYWESLDTPLEDIERIEVIRGPGAAMWGANAVNGVINIITKDAADTKGGLVSSGSGSSQPGFGTVRYGASLGKDTDIRVYAKYASRGPGRLGNGADAHDAWQSATTGFRLDNQVTEQDKLTLQSEYTTGYFEENYNLYQPSAPTSWSQNTVSRSYNGNILGKWQRNISETDSLSLQLYYDRYDRSMLVLNEKRDTVDMDFQHRFALGQHQDIIWGAGYRYSYDRLGQTPYISFGSLQKGTSLFSAFVQDEIKLIEDKLALIIGSRLDHNDFTGFEVQPNARLIWTPTQRHTIWASISRAVRTPSRTDRDIHYNFRRDYGLSIDGSRTFKSESVIAYELGYRTELTKQVSADLALFYNQYDKLRVLQYGIPTTGIASYALTNNMHGHTYGVEISSTWRPFDWWKLQASYSYLCSIMYLDNGSTDENNRANAAGGSPRNQGSLRSGFNIGSQVELDLWLRAMDRIKSIDSKSYPGYVTMDARIAWKPLHNLELSLVGRNLFQRRQAEYRPEVINTTASEVPRSVYGKVTWKF